MTLSWKLILAGYILGACWTTVEMWWELDEDAGDTRDLEDTILSGACAALAGPCWPGVLPFVYWLQWDRRRS